MVRDIELLVNPQHALWVKARVLADPGEFRSGARAQIVELAKAAGEHDLADRTRDGFSDSSICGEVRLLVDEIVDALAEDSDPCGGALVSTDFVGIFVLGREQLSQAGEAVGDFSIAHRGTHYPRSEWPKSLPCAIRSRTSCLSSLISGNRPLSARDQMISSWTRTSNTPPTPGIIASSPISVENVVRSSCAIQAVRKSQRH